MIPTSVSGTLKPSSRARQVIVNIATPVGGKYLSALSQFHLGVIDARPQSRFS
jgi:hypothetical protein